MWYKSTKINTENKVFSAKFILHSPFGTKVNLLNSYDLQTENYHDGIYWKDKSRVKLNFKQFLKRAIDIQINIIIIIGKYSND